MDRTRTAFLRDLMHRYGGAFLVIALTIAVRLALAPWLGNGGFAVFLIGVLIAAWVGGLGPALLSQTVLLVVAAVWFPDSRPPQTPGEAIVGLAAYYIVGGLVGFLSQTVHAARQRAAARSAEAAAQREWLHTTLACMADGVVAADPAGRVTMMNPAAERMTRWPAAEALGQPLARVLEIELANSASRANPVERVLQEGRSHATRGLLLPNARGPAMPIAYDAAPIADAEGRTTGVVVVFRDETDRQRTEETLRAADRRKDEFLATLAHELRNPLAPIRTGLEVLKLAAHDPAQSAEVHAMLERQTNQMVRLIDDLLDVSRFTRGKLKLIKSTVELSAIVHSAVEASQPLIQAAGHSLDVSLPEEPVRFVADGNRLTQVISNLLHNAAKYTSPGGRIELTASTSAGELLLQVRDTGQGIPRDMQQRIFEMFTQIQSAHGAQEGLGIGLTLVKWIVELHDGAVEAQSDGPGRGSTFLVRLPLNADQKVAPAAIDTPPAAPTALLAAAPATNGSPRRRILVVDDNRDARDMLSVMVRRLGNEVRTASDGQEAVEAAEAWSPDVIFMDLGMPRLDGCGAARQIRSQPCGQDVLLVAITGWGQEEDCRRTNEAGFDQHLVKPVEFDALQRILEWSHRSESPPSERHFQECHSWAADSASA